jgi:hypothetical protein
MTEQNLPEDRAGLSQDASFASPSGITDEVQVELKGPDPEIWGDDADRPPSLANQGSQGVEAGAIHNEGTQEEVKGPDPTLWEQDDQGNYVNR